MAQPAADIPTFLFTDIEGSTRLWEQVPAAMQRALQQHDRLARAALTAGGGLIFKTVGDAFCAVFADPGAAAAAALALQRALRDAEWPTPRPLLVRAAIHTGAAERRDDDYFGPALNRVARMMGAGHGGQILVSAASAELLRAELAAGALPGAELRDLGARRLKDLRQIEHIYQLAAPDLPATFPPLLTIDARPTNLPAAPTGLLGRDREVAEAGALLRQQEVRLLTLTGPGGTGKTRLSMQLGAELLDEFEQGVFFVALAPITDPALVPATIAQALELQEGAGSAPLAALQSFLRERQLLLVLDNFEQIVAAAPLLAELLAAAPRLKLLVSSRAVLRLYGEHEFPVPPLALPDGGELAVERIALSPAVQLFARRARAARADFALSEANAAAVAGICQRLDGLPLAIELAAARARLFTPEAMLGRLGSRLQLLTGGPRDLPARQQTLRGAIDWGYRLLSAGEQRLFSRLAVFAGGWTLEAAERICGGAEPETVLEGLAALVDNSLVRQAEADGAPRYHMLETIREYALEQLEAGGQAAATRDAHLAWFVESAEAGAAELAETVAEPVLRSLARELDNLRAAFAHGLAVQPALASRLAAALRQFWEMRGNWREGFGWIESSLAANPPGAAEAPLRARLLEAGGLMANHLNRFEQARAYCAESLAIRRGLGDPVALAQSLYSLGETLHNLGRYAETMALWEESLAVYRSINHEYGEAWALFQICWEWLYLGDSQRAVAVAGEMVALRRRLPDQRMTGWSLGHAASILAIHGDVAGAQALADEAEAMFGRFEDLSGLGYAGALRGRIFQLQGRYAEALPLIERHVAVARQLERSQRIAGALLDLACLLAEAPGGAAEIERALESLAESVAILRTLDDRVGLVYRLVAGAAVARARGDARLAARLAGAVEQALLGYNTAMHPLYEPPHRRARDWAEAGLGAEAFRAARAGGAAAPLEQMIDEALNQRPATRSGDGD